MPNLARFFFEARIFVILSIVLAGRTAIAQTVGDPIQGKAAFVRQCALCHTIGKDEPNRYGPNLHGIIGRKAGTVPGYQYSRAFQARATWEWTRDTLGGWISAPGLMVPGSKMAVFEGGADRDRDDILAFIGSEKE